MSRVPLQIVHTHCLINTHKASGGYNMWMRKLRCKKIKRLAQAVLDIKQEGQDPNLGTQTPVGRSRLQRMVPHGDSRHFILTAPNSTNRLHNPTVM